jgi:hypothetical protein
MGTLKTCFVDGSPGSWPALADVAREIVAHWGKVFRSSFDQGQFGKARGLAKKVWGIWIDHVCGTTTRLPTFLTTRDWMPPPDLALLIVGFLSSLPLLARLHRASRVCRSSSSSHDRHGISASSRDEL